MKESKWRTLVRIVDFDSSRDKVTVTIPSRGTEGITDFQIPRSSFPVGMVLFSGKRIYAQVNKGTDRVEDLEFSDWED